MDNFRLILFMVFAFLSLLLYQQWQIDYGPDTQAGGSTATTTTAEGSQNPSTASPVSSHDSNIQLPSHGGAPGAIPQSPGQGGLLQSGGRIQIDTDVLQVEIDRRGGDLRLLNLLGYPVDVEKPENPLRLMNDQLPHVFVLQSGFFSQQDTATEETQYQSEQQQYRLNEGQDELEVVLRWEAPEDAQQAISVEKIYRFKRGSYVIALEHRINNHSDTPWSGRLFGQMQRTQIAESGQSSMIYTYMGGAIASPDTLYDKVTFDDIKEGGADAYAYIAPDSSVTKSLQEPWVGGWVAMLQHYFVAALVPEKEQLYYYYSKYLSQGSRYVLGLYGPDTVLNAGEEQQMNFQFYAGPKVQADLEVLAPGLELTVDYGYLWFIAQPLFWLLKYIHDIVGNWGWSIILLTLCIKLAFFQLSATSYKSMANMRRMQPRLVQLKERYANDKAGMNQAMMELYKKEKINPLGGCLPILVQIPVFIALYWVLLESVELRQASFILWLNNLSKPDPYFILPLVMGATMLLQHRLNPAPLDPMQAKIMMMLPLVFTVFFAFFPAGLVLYWTVNNMLSIAQQWYITRKIAGDV